MWIADRGFARLSLFQFLADLAMDFCIRVEAETKIAWQGRKLLHRIYPPKKAGSSGWRE